MVGLKTEERPLSATTAKSPHIDFAPDTRHRMKVDDDLFCSSEVRILILDDDPAVGRVIQTALARKDFTVDAVSDPALMKGHLQEKTYHIVILDYVIPGLESDRVLGWVRESQP